MCKNCLVLVAILVLASGSAAQSSCNSPLWYYGLHFDGLTSLADLPASVSAVIGDDSTIAFWAYFFEEFTDNQVFLDNIDVARGIRLVYEPGVVSGSGQLDVALGYDDGMSGAVEVLLLDKNDAEALERSVFFETPRHFALTMENISASEATIIVYLDGEEIATSTVSGQLWSSTLPLRLGGVNGGGNFAELVINESMVYDYVLTAAEIHDRLFIDPLSLSSGDQPEHYYPDPDTLAPNPASMWEDVGATGAQDAQLGDTVWGKPVPVESLVSCS